MGRPGDGGRRRGGAASTGRSSAGRTSPPGPTPAATGSSSAAASRSPGVGPLMDPQQPPAWSSYVTVEDLDATAEKRPQPRRSGGCSGQWTCRRTRAAWRSSSTPPARSSRGFQPGQHKGAELVNEPVSLAWNEHTSRDPRDGPGVLPRALRLGVPQAGGRRTRPALLDLPLPELGRRARSAGCCEMDENFPEGLPNFWGVYFAVDRHRRDRGEGEGGGRSGPRGAVRHAAGADRERLPTPATRRLLRHRAEPGLRALSDPFEVLEPEQRELLRPSAMPSFFEPMKATLAADAFDDPAWVFERKLDGIRALVFRDGDEVRLFSRTGRALTGYPELEECARGRPVQAVRRRRGDRRARRGRRHQLRAAPGADGDRRSRLRRGAPASRSSSTSSTSSGSRATTRASCRCSPARSSSRARWRFDGPVGFVSHVPEHGKTLYAKACEAGYEGLIAKRAESTYVCRRSRDWLKLKCHFEQEFVVIGFTAPKGSRTEFGALLAGYWEGDELQLRRQGRHGLQP